MGFGGDQQAGFRERQPCCNSACLLPRDDCIRPHRVFLLVCVENCKSIITIFLLRTRLTTSDQPSHSVTFVFPKPVASTTKIAREYSAEHLHQRIGLQSMSYMDRNARSIGLYHPLGSVPHATSLTCNIRCKIPKHQRRIGKTR